MAPGHPPLVPQAVALDLEVHGKMALLHAAAQMLKGFCRIEAEPIFRALHRREQAGSTAVGNGLAIPHARIPGIDRPLTLYLRTKVPLPLRRTRRQAGVGILHHGRSGGRVARNAA